MHVQPLRDNDADDHNLMLSTLTGSHGVFMAQAELQDADWYDNDDSWYDPDDGWIYPPPGAGSNAIHFQNLDGGYGVLYFDDQDRYVWASFKPAADNTNAAIAAPLDELTRVAPDPVVFWNFPDEAFEIYFGQAGIDLFRARQEEDDFNAFGDAVHQEQGSVDVYDFQLVDSGATAYIAPDHAVNAMVEAAPGGPAAWAPPVVPHQEPMLGPAVIVDEAVDPLPEGFHRCSVLINCAPGLIDFGLLRDSSFSL